MKLMISIVFIGLSMGIRHQFEQRSSSLLKTAGNTIIQPFDVVPAPQAPAIEDVPIQDITSVYSQDLQSQIDDATLQKEKNAYTVRFC